MPAKDAFEDESGGVVLDIIRSRPGAQLAQLLRGEVDAVVSVHSLNHLLRAAADENVPIDASILKSVAVGMCDTVLLLNRKNTVTQLTGKQLKGIFSGKITNWKQLNGLNREIVVIWNVAPTADNDTFIRGILDEEKFEPKLYPVYSYEEVRKLTAEIPEAIGIAPSVYAAASVTVPKSPKVSAPAIVVTKGTPSQQVSNLTEILKDMSLLH
jgi:phosphate transport system substrate-binding protein